MSPADHPSALTGRATDSQFAQNPLPVLEAMGAALAGLHLGAPSPDLRPATDGEVETALAAIDSGIPLPHPYARADPATVRRVLLEPPTSPSPPVTTHGAPVVASVGLRDGEAFFDEAGSGGLDPAERDLAIALRSIAETFAPEATMTFLDAYEATGGVAPDAATLDWYAVVAAFR